MTSPENQPHSHTSFQIPYPRGLLRWFMRVPIFLYRLHLGWLLGKRFLLLEHRGRRSGLPRQAVIEVVDHDPIAGKFVVAAAWGIKSDWFQNILAAPNVYITVANRRFSALATRISAEASARHLRAYAVRNPFAFRLLGSRLVGTHSRNLDETITAFVESVPFVEFSPA